MALHRGFGEGDAAVPLEEKLAKILVAFDFFYFLFFIVYFFCLDGRGKGMSVDAKVDSGYVGHDSRFRPHGPLPKSIKFYCVAIEAQRLSVPRLCYNTKITCTWGLGGGLVWGHFSTPSY